MPRNDGLPIEVQTQARDREAPRDVAAGLPDLPYVRLTQRAPPPREWRSLWLLLALVLLAHALLVWLGWTFLRPVPLHVGEGGAISVSVIEPASELPLPPALVPPPPLPGQPPPTARPAPPPRVRYEPPAKGAMSATLESGKGKPLELYNTNGQIRLSSGAAQPSTPASAYSAPGLKASQIYNGKSPVPYKPTRFSKDFEPTNQSLGAQTLGRAFDKAVEKTTVTKTVHLPAGINVHCAVSPLVLFAGCKGDDPQPPPKNDDDIRLSMPPAVTLTGKKVVVPTSASTVPPPASGSGP